MTDWKVDDLGCPMKDFLNQIPRLFFFLELLLVAEFVCAGVFDLILAVLAFVARLAFLAL